jgi:FixJ family two-component response regulator
MMTMPVVEAFRSALDFLASPMIARTSCLIADVHMPGMSGIELYSEVVKLGYDFGTILVNAYPDARIKNRAINDGVTCYLTKPFNDNTLLACVGSALARANPGKKI